MNSYPLVQFTRASIRRDLDKAFCGFSGRDKGDKGESGDRFDIATGIYSSLLFFLFLLLFFILFYFI